MSMPLTKILLDSPTSASYRMAIIGLLLGDLPPDEQSAAVKTTLFELLDFSCVLLDIIAEQPELCDQVQAGWLALEFDRLTYTITDHG
ncbi:hypothetical protein E3T54_03515 [Cryobacterium sp. Sr8]|uniref:hypothetical protein n=1 Tax=Cryobacterium sp. Sr8 TaxID=1259203 RepID=UPI0010690DA5|nr:hypothetical protein [Cryobacterium sp. Sr8]TFD80309.1 hypothetical protein E3T54_03515 [Cryobacterium sp. Sr8]